MTHTHTVGLPWTSDRPAAEASTYTTQTQVNHSSTAIRTRDPDSQAAADLRLKPHGHRDKL